MKTRVSFSRQTLNSRNGGSLFTDTQMAAAMIDRLVHHGQLIFEGPSYRMEHALMRQDGSAPSQSQTIPPKTGNSPR